MQISVATLKNLLIGVILLFGVGLVVTAILLNKQHTGQPAPQATNVVTQVAGKQIIDLTAKGGYSPSVIEAKAGVETILRVSTKNTFDCSSALTIPSLGLSKTLPANGKTDIVIAAQQTGATINGTCSMGMYSFKINFT